MDNNSLHFGRKEHIILSFYFLQEWEEENVVLSFEKLQAVEVAAHQQSILLYTIAL